HGAERPLRPYAAGLLLLDPDSFAAPALDARAAGHVAGGSLPPRRARKRAASAAARDVGTRRAAADGGVQQAGDVPDAADSRVVGLRGLVAGGSGGQRFGEGLGSADPAHTARLCRWHLPAARRVVALDRLGVPSPGGPRAGSGRRFERFSPVVWLHVPGDW